MGEGIQGYAATRVQGQEGDTAMPALGAQGWQWLGCISRKWGLAIQGHRTLGGVQIQGCGAGVQGLGM